MGNKSDENENIKIGKMLQEARESSGVTQQDIAEATGMTKNHISKVERGQSKASISLLLGYCDKLKMKPNDILGFHEKGILPEMGKLLRDMDMSEQRKFYEMARIFKS